MPSPRSVYKIIDIVGSSENSWEEAARNAVDAAGEKLHNLRVAEVEKLDVRYEEGKFFAYRAKLHLSFKVDRD
jgi:flavin-binding protein dodecin